MILFIDATNFNKVTFAIKDKKIRKESFKIDPHRSHETLQKLAEFLKSRKLNSPAGGASIKSIVVNKGPGSYTGVRVGVTIAQALGYAWGIPIRAIAKEKFAIK